MHIERLLTNKDGDDDVDETSNDSDQDDRDDDELKETGKKAKKKEEMKEQSENWHPCLDFVSSTLFAGFETRSLPARTAEVGSKGSVGLWLV